MHVVATAGHVDHGKSTLVLGLSGTDPDRWAEEKERGLTIDLGFAHLQLPSGREVALVDVPGHVRFLRNMLAGVGAVDAALFVVAATEGWKPQSEEHLRILELLGVTRAVVALTKVDLVDEDTLTLAQLEVDERLSTSALAGAEVVGVAAPAGAGLGELRAALDRLLASTPTSADRGRPRLWVDRSFVARGSGTVVTGTLAGGCLAVDDELEVVGPGAAAAGTGPQRGPRARGGRLRVRALQTHGTDRATVGPGRRVAVNLSGAGHGDLVRGDALVRPGQWHVTRRVDVSLRVLDSLDHPVSRRGAYQVYLGSGEHAVRLRILGPADIEPGDEGFARMHLPAGLALVPGDRYVLRESGRGETVGGGEVLDVDPVLPAARARPSRSAERVVAERGWVEAAHLARLTGEAWTPPSSSGPAGAGHRPPLAPVGPWVVDPAVMAREQDSLALAVAAAGPLGLDVASLTDRHRHLLERLEDVTVRAGRAVAARRAGANGAAGDGPGGPAHGVKAAGMAWVGQLRDAPWATPDPAAAGVGRDMLRLLVSDGAVVERDGVWFAAETVAGAGTAVARLLAASPDGVTVAEVRDALGATRKHTIPLLSHLDATGVTRRRGDLRIAGPRLAPPGR
ncbi:MAG: selenocysteine-specific translation elongation factor [Acidimicrobiales bacterium]